MKSKDNSENGKLKAGIVKFIKNLEEENKYYTQQAKVLAKDKQYTDAAELQLIVINQEDTIIFLKRLLQDSEVINL